MSTRKVYIYIYIYIYIFIEYSSHHEFHSRIKSNCNAAFLNNVDQKCPRERERERERDSLFNKKHILVLKIK